VPVLVVLLPPLPREMELVETSEIVVESVSVGRRVVEAIVPFV